jgi:hypothetical protein
MFDNERQKSAEKSVVATRHLRREIALMLAIKAMLLYGIWLAFFSEPQLPKMTAGMDPGRVAATLIPPKTTITSRNP